MIRISWVCALFYASTALAEPTQWSTLDGGNGHFYELVAEPLSWTDAVAAATARPIPALGYGEGHLATISDVAEEQFLLSTYFPETNVGNAWFGFTDQDVEGEWRWIDDTPGIWQDPNYFASPIQTAYVNWAPSEPNNADDLEDYGILNWGGQWNDGTNIYPYQYLVEWQPVPEPSTLALALIGGVFFVRILRRDSAQ